MSIDMSGEIDREWEEQSARYGAMSEAEMRALPIGEVIEAFFYTFPDPTPYARAWYEQRPARERFRMRVKSWEDLIEAYCFGTKKELPSHDSILAILELDRRARDAGYGRTGQWLKNAFDRERDRLNAGTRESGTKCVDRMVIIAGEEESL
jgi:hypothetical protein